MKKRTIPLLKQQVIIPVIGVAVIALAGSLLYQQHQITNLKDSQALQTQLLHNDINGNAQASAVVISPQDNRVYVPELRVSLPFNEITKTLRYTYSEQHGARFYSTLVTDHKERRISCYDMVRAKHEVKRDAYSPYQPHTATVPAGDTPLQLYAETDAACAAEAWFQITPAAIAEELKQARAY